jgi:hypothetical protein
MQQQAMLDVDFFVDYLNINPDQLIYS